LGFPSVRGFLEVEAPLFAMVREMAAEHSFGNETECLNFQPRAAFSAIFFFFS
jgi:hypothetical protein